MRCKTLTAIYKNEINTLKKLYEIDFLIHESVRIHIEQFTVRKIEIDFTSEQLVDDLIAVLTKVERLLMLFDGYFMNLISIEFQDSAGCVPPNLKECAEHFMRRRLSKQTAFFAVQHKVKSPKSQVFRQKCTYSVILTLNYTDLQVRSYKIVLIWKNCAIGYKNKQDIAMKDLPLFSW